MANLSALPQPATAAGGINDADPVIGVVEGARADEDVLAAFGAP
jgi:hypothetical protein